MYNLDDQLVSELVHCVEEDTRPWSRLYRIAHIRDMQRGFCVSETHWEEWLGILERIVRTARVAPHDISGKDRNAWSQVICALPAVVADEDVDEVVYTIRVRERLESFLHQHAPCRRQEYEIE